jgi:predicted RNA-binding Zn-ribbon protein involved in translation (DUF1610 family)
MSSAIFARCHSCTARIKAPAQMIGQVHPCPRCRKPILIRNGPPRDAGPVLVGDEEASERDRPTRVISW